jgi:hypothetical protein
MFILTRDDKRRRARVRAEAHTGALYKNERGKWTFQVADWEGAQTRYISGVNYWHARRLKAETVRAFTRQYLEG